MHLLLASLDNIQHSLYSFNSVRALNLQFQTGDIHHGFWKVWLSITDNDVLNHCFKSNASVADNPCSLNMTAAINCRSFKLNCWIYLLQFLQTFCLINSYYNVGQNNNGNSSFNGVQQLSLLPALGNMEASWRESGKLATYVGLWSHANSDIDTVCPVCNVVYRYFLCIWPHSYSAMNKGRKTSCGSYFLFIILPLFVTSNFPTCSSTFSN